MYRNFGISLFLIAASVSGFAQKPSDPALIAKYERATKLYFDAESEWKDNNIFTKTKALDLAKESADLFREIRSNEEVVLATHFVGKICLDLDASQKALEFFTYALNSMRQIKYKNDKVEAALLNNTAIAYFHLGERQKSLEFYEQSLERHRGFGDKQSETVILDNMGGLYLEMGEPQKALEFYNSARTLSRSLKNTWREAVALANLGKVYVRLGDDIKAKEYFELSLTTDKDQRSMEALEGMANLYLRRRDFDKAYEAFIDVVSTYIFSGNRRGMAVANLGLAAVFEGRGETEKALSQYQLGVDTFRELGERGNEGIALRRLGDMHRRMGDVPKARQHYFEALPILISIGDLSGEADALGSLQDIFAGDLSVFYGKQAVNAYQTLRQKIRGLNKEDQKTYLRSIEGTYRKLAGTLIDLGRLAEALQVLNAFKDQQYFDFESTGAKKPIPLSMTVRETELSSRMATEGAKLGTAGAKHAGLVRKLGQLAPTPAEKVEIARADAELRSSTLAFKRTVTLTQGLFANPPAVEPVMDIPDLAQLQRSIRDLKTQTGHKSVAVFQLVGETSFSALVVTADSIDKISSPITATRLNEKAKKLWSLFRSDRFDTTILSREIYNLVAAPLFAKIPVDTQTIMWSLDGNLRYIPMAALFDGEKFLVERYNNVTFTRPDYERMTRSVSPKWLGTGFGTSLAAKVTIANESVSFAPLPGVISELDSIFKTKPGDTGEISGAVLPDRVFTRTSFIASLRSGRPLAHIASHFYFRPGDESRSFLLLGDSTAFSLDEMKREGDLFKGIELLTLSACETAASQADANGREIDGFAELAQRLGAGAVMASLWPVSDNSTPRLMRDFYQGKTALNLTKAEALRKAQVEMLRGSSKKPAASATRTRNGVRAELYAPSGDGPKFKPDPTRPFAHPFYWAPFVLIGNWK